jgi:hypothetical protein
MRRKSRSANYDALVKKYRIYKDVSMIIEMIGAYPSYKNILDTLRAQEAR